MKLLSLIIPAHNEEQRIAKTILYYLAYFRQQKINFELIIILNGCKDNSAEILKKLSKNKEIIYRDIPEAIGKGGAIVEGFKLARGSVIGFTDADAAFKVESLRKMFSEIDSGVDCIIASKWKNRSFFSVDEPFLKKFMSRGWNALVKILLGLNFADTQGGAKFFSRQVFEKINKKFICPEFTFDVELLYKIKEAKFKIKEIHVPNKYIEGSTFKLTYAFPMFGRLIKLWWLKLNSYF